MTPRKQAPQIVIEPLLVDVPTAATLTGISETKIYEYVNSEEWPSVRIRGEGARIRIPIEGLRRWIEANTSGGLRVANTPNRVARHVAKQDSSSGDERGR